MYACIREKITWGLWVILPPKCKKEPSKIKKSPWKLPYRLQCKSLFNVADLVNGMWKSSPWKKKKKNWNVCVCIHKFFIILTTVCNLLEGSAVMHSPLAAHFPQFLGAMTRTSTRVVADITTAAPTTMITPDLSAHSLTLSKLALQTCQLVPRHLTEVLRASQGNLGTQSDLSPQLSELIGNLFSMMCSKVCLFQCYIVFLPWV